MKSGERLQDARTRVTENSGFVDRILEGGRLATLDESDKEYLGPAKFAILRKLQAAGWPLTGADIDGATQDSVVELRDWSKRVFALLNRVPRNVAEARRLGFSLSFEGRLMLGTTGSRLSTVGILERELAHGVTTTLYATIQGRLRWNNLRKPSRADRKYL